MFKIGDVVVITPPEDHRHYPGFNGEMQSVLEGNNFKMVLGRSRCKDRGYWYCQNDPGIWVWSEAWMKKVNKFKGNIK